MTECRDPLESVAGECRPSPWEIEEVGPVDGKPLLHLHERDKTHFGPFPGIFEPSRTNYWRLKPQFPRIPLSYTLKMRGC